MAWREGETVGNGTRVGVGPRVWWENHNNCHELRFMRPRLLRCFPEVPGVVACDGQPGRPGVRERPALQRVSARMRSRLHPDGLGRGKTPGTGGPGRVVDGPVGIWEVVGVGESRRGHGEQTDRSPGGSGRARPSAGGAGGAEAAGRVAGPGGRWMCGTVDRAPFLRSPEFK